MLNYQRVLNISWMQVWTSMRMVRTKQLIPCGCRARWPEAPLQSVLLISQDNNEKSSSSNYMTHHDTLRIPLCYLVLFGSIWIYLVSPSPSVSGQIWLQTWSPPSLGQPRFLRQSRTVQLQASESLTIGEWLATPKSTKFSVNIIFLTSIATVSLWGIPHFQTPPSGSCMSRTVFVGPGPSSIAAQLLQSLMPQIHWVFHPDPAGKQPEGTNIVSWAAELHCFKKKNHLIFYQFLEWFLWVSIYSPHALPGAA